MKNPVLLRLDGVDVTLKADNQDLSILHDISLDFFPGQSTAIVGPSGSGKTTLMMVCAGLQTPRKGELLFQGEPLPFKDENAMTAWRRDHIGIVFQNFHLLPTNTALENVMLPLELAEDEDPRRHATSFLEAVGLKHRLDHLPGQLSGGEQQRVALARALARRPKILLADEPTGNLDQATGQHVMELLFDQAEKNGITLILITHDEKLAARCNRIVTLHDGRIVPHA